MKNFSLAFTIALIIISSESRNIDLLPNESIKTQQQYALAIEAIFGMGVRLHALLKDDQYTSKNFIVSPISVTTVIAQLLLGCEGELREDLYDLLSLPKMNHQYSTINHYNNQNNESYTLPYSQLHLQLASLLKNLQTNKMNGKQFTLFQHNGAFINNKLKLKSRFKTQLSKFYDTEIYPMDFNVNRTQSQEFINNWAAIHTNNLIRNILAAPPNPTTMAIFMNAIYFLAEWQTPFSNELNNEGSFFVQQNQIVNTTYMLGNIERILYSQTENYRFICLPYKNNELGMYILLPNDNHQYKYDIKKFTQSLDSKEIVNTINNAKLKDVIVKIPKLAVSNTISILEPLRKYSEYKKQEKSKPNTNGNILDVLKEKVDSFTNFTGNGTDLYLNNAVENSKLLISDVVQQLVFSINEKGTEAAAITASVMDYIDSSETFIIDRPFLFFIRHKDTLATLFWGTISDPTSN